MQSALIYHSLAAPRTCSTSFLHAPRQSAHRRCQIQCGEAEYDCQDILAIGTWFRQTCHVLPGRATGPGISSRTRRSAKLFQGECWVGRKSEESAFIEQRLVDSNWQVPNGVRHLRENCERILRKLKALDAEYENPRHTFSFLFLATFPVYFLFFVFIGHFIGSSHVWHVMSQWHGKCLLFRAAKWMCLFVMIFRFYEPDDASSAQWRSQQSQPNGTHTHFLMPIARQRIHLLKWVCGRWSVWLQRQSPFIRRMPDKVINERKKHITNRSLAFDTATLGSRCRSWWIYFWILQLYTSFVSGRQRKLRQGEHDFFSLGFPIEIMLLFSAFAQPRALIPYINFDARAGFSLAIWSLEITKYKIELAACQPKCLNCTAAQPPTNTSVAALRLQNVRSFVRALRQLINSINIVHRREKDSFHFSRISKYHLTTRPSTSHHRNGSVSFTIFFMCAAIIDLMWP